MRDEQTSFPPQSNTRDGSGIRSPARGSGRPRQGTPRPGHPSSGQSRTNARFAALARKRLLSLRDELGNSSKGPSPDQTSRRSRSEDVADRAAASLESEFSGQVGHVVGRALGEIEAALERLDRGTYGICEDCGNAIPRPRLEALPWASLCVACKARQEAEDGDAPAGPSRWREADFPLHEDD